MKVKMVKMGMDIDETKNHRIRGIVPTDDNKYLFVEILQGNRISKNYTNLTFKEYNEKYPYQNYICVDSCFRVDRPKDYYDNYSSEYKDYDRTPFYHYDYTPENILKVLQELNPNITEVELTDDHYIDDYCAEKGFFRLYDNRLEHSYDPIEITHDFKFNNQFKVKFQYSCKAVDGDVYTEEKEYLENKDELIEKYGEEKINHLLDKYKEKTSLYEMEV